MAEIVDRLRLPCPYCQSSSTVLRSLISGDGSSVFLECPSCDRVIQPDKSLLFVEPPSADPRPSPDQQQQINELLSQQPCPYCPYDQHSLLMYNDVTARWECIRCQRTVSIQSDINDVMHEELSADDDSTLHGTSVNEAGPEDIQDVSALGELGAAALGRGDGDEDEDDDDGDGNRIAAACQCGETDATQNILCRDGTGTIITHVVCQTCDRVTTLVSRTFNGDVPTRDIPVTDVDQLRPGDHVKWPIRAGLYWHHVIVTEVEAERIRVIEYKKGNSHSIEHNWVQIGRDRMTRVDYDSSYPDEVVVARARSRLGERDYGLCNNNCEHFSRWCKIGDDTSCQVVAVDTGLRGGIKLLVNGVKHLAVKVAEACCSKATFGAILSDSVGNIGPRNILGCASGLTAKALCFGIGIVLNIVVDGVTLGLAIRDAVNKKRQNVLSHAEFIRKVIRISVSKGLGCLGSIVGSIIGCVLIPIPILGGLIGSGLGWLLDYISYKLIPHMITV